MESSNAPASRIDRGFITAGGLLLVIGAVLAGLTFSQKDGMDRLAEGYLYGWVFWACISFGCFGLSLLFHVTRGRWGTPVLRIFEAGGGPGSLALTFLGLIPVVLWKDHLYHHWLHPEPGDTILADKAGYLNFPFWLIRLVIYAVLFIGLAHLLKKWTRNEERTGDKKWSDLRNNFAAPGIVMFVVVMNFMMTDLVMSLDPHWFSTMFGVWFVVGSALGALGLTVAIVCSQSDKKPFDEVITPSMTKDFGNLLLMLTMLWAYFSFSQYLIIWSGNLPEFISYYVKRSVGNFNAVGATMIIGQFFIPYLLLLSPRTKRTAKILAFVGGWIFLMRLVDMYYTVIPFFSATALPVPTGVLAGLTALGGLWLLMFGIQYRQAPQLTSSHPYMKEAEAHA